MSHKAMYWCTAHFACSAVVAFSCSAAAHAQGGPFTIQVGPPATATLAQEQWEPEAVWVSDQEVYTLNIYMNAQILEGPSPFVPDRRPIIVISMFNGSYNLNPYGLGAGWYGLDENGNVKDEISGRDPVTGSPIAGANGVPDAFDNVLFQLNHNYDKGFRRFLFRMPAGSSPVVNQNGESVNAFEFSQYWTMEEWRRQGFWNYIKPWIDGKAAVGDPVSMELYMGSSLHDPANRPQSTSEFENANMSDPDHVKWLHQAVKPWIMLGFSKFWLDASGVVTPVFEGSSFTVRDVLASLRLNPTWNGVFEFGGEPVPVTSSWEPEHALLDDAPWLGAQRYIESRFGDDLDNALVGITSGPVFDPQSTEVVVWMLEVLNAMCGVTSSDPNFIEYCNNLQRVRNYVDQGLVLAGFGLVDKSYGKWINDPNNPGSVIRIHPLFDYPHANLPELMQRLLSFGPITALADFDGDGLIRVNPQGVSSDCNVVQTEGPFDDVCMADSIQFVEAWWNSISTQKANPGFYDGDINGDGVVDVVDFDTFEAAANAWLLTNEVVGIDLGKPSWVP